MLRHVSFEALEGSRITRLAESMLAAPRPVRPSANEMILDLAAGRARAFEWDGGFVVCSPRDGRLVLEALCCDNLVKSAAPLTEALRRLAADWECDTIETTVFDPRLTSVIEKVGGRVESVTLVLPVE